MRRFIRRDTHTVMWVADERVEEYKAEGHILADPPSASAPESPAAEKKPVVKKTTKHKTTKK